MNIFLTVLSAVRTACNIFIAFCIPATILVLAIAAHGPIVAPGVIALDGYAHGVVLCGEATVINAGHEADPQVAELLALAAEMCPTFTAH